MSEIIFVIYYAVGWAFASVARTLVLLSVAAVLRTRFAFSCQKAARTVALFLPVLSIPLGLAYLADVVLAFFGEPMGWFVYVNRAFGPAAWFYWLTLFGLCVVPHMFWWHEFRQNRLKRFVLALAVVLGVELEGFVLRMSGG